MATGREESGIKSSEGGRGASDQASPATVERYLQGVDFPCDKQGLVQQAKSNDAPQDVINEIEQLSDKEYSSPIDVSKEIGRLH